MKSIHLLLTSWLSLVAAPLIAAKTDLTKPNIIVIYTDDHGYADLGIQGAVQDIRTPNIDALARSGVLAKHGYSTAPQCMPSRAGLLVGKFQNRFNLESNGHSLDGFNKETTIATRLQQAGYTTAQFGKWHLGPDAEIPNHGFKHVFAHAGQPAFFANITLDGNDRPMGRTPSARYHLDGCSQAAAAIIARYKNDPFFLYIAYRAPHTPLDAPKSYTARFPGEMPERRRQALAMLSAVDDGVGLITATLKKHDLTERTLIIMIGDNGAPLKIHKTDTPLNGDAGGWDGSLNTPLNGEKGMLSEGGMHVPFVVSWPGAIPSGQSYDKPVSALDVAATAAALANIPTKPGDLDGVNILPHLKGEIKTPPHDALYWRWIAQSAIREGDWKLLRGGNREYLYDLGHDLEEKNNLAASHPDIARRLREKLGKWCGGLATPGLTSGPMAATWNDYFDYYLEGKTHTGRPGKPSKAETTTANPQAWIARNATLTEKDGIFKATPEMGPKGKSPFLTNAQMKLETPATAKFTLKNTTGGQAGFSWRTAGQKDFLSGNRIDFPASASDEWQTHEIRIPATGTITHIRLLLPGGISEVREIGFETIPK